MMRRLLLCLLLTLPGPAAAAEGVPLFYTRDMLTIQRAVPGPPPGDAPLPPPLRFDVEVRDAGAYYRQKGWFNLSGPNDDSGVLLVFAQAGRSPIIASGQYAPLDILFIDAQGRITQMLPSIHLSTLTQQIVPQNPVLAFLFLKSGTCRRYAINPGDRVDYSLFQKAPLVLGDPVILMDAPPAASRQARIIKPVRRPAAPQVNKAAAAQAKKMPLPLLPPLPPARQETPQQTPQQSPQQSPQEALRGAPETQQPLEEPQINLPVVALPPSP